MSIIKEEELRLKELVCKSLHHYRNLIIAYNEELGSRHKQLDKHEVLNYGRLLDAIDFSKHTLHLNLNFYDPHDKPVSINDPHGKPVSIKNPYGDQASINDLLNLYEFMCEYRHTSPEKIKFTNHLLLLNNLIAGDGYSYEKNYGNIELSLVYIKYTSEGKLVDTSINLGLIKSRLEDIERETTIGIMYNILSGYNRGCTIMLKTYHDSFLQDDGE